MVGWQLWCQPMERRSRLCRSRVAGGKWVPCACIRLLQAGRWWPERKLECVTTSHRGLQTHWHNVFSHSVAPVSSQSRNTWRVLEHASFSAAPSGTLQNRGKCLFSIIDTSGLGPLDRGRW